MRTLMRHRLHAVLAAVVAVCVAGGGIAYATGALATASSDVVTACVKKDGSVRIVDTASQCTKNENAVLLQAALAAQPTSFTVHCNQGETIGAVLDQVADGTRPVTITVRGHCDEDVAISRDGISLVAGGPNATIRSVSVWDARQTQLTGLALGSLSVSNGATGGFDSLHVTGAVDVGGGADWNIVNSTIDNGLSLDGGSLEVNNTTITHGDWTTVVCHSGSLGLHNVDVSASPQDGVGAWGTCRLTIDGGRVHDNASFGVGSWEGASIDVQNGAVIENNQRGGALAQSGGSLWISDSTVRGNGEQGVSGYMGGHVNVSRSTIENNTTGGLTLTAGSSGGIDTTTIRDNNGDGVDIQDTSVLMVNSSDNSITGNSGWGVWCQPAPAVAQVNGAPDLPTTLGASVSGNGAGQVSCPFSGQPPVVTVDCANGDKLADALDQVAARTEPVTFELEGMCDEQVEIDRDNVTLNAASPNAGIRGLDLNDVRGIQIHGLTFGPGGFNAMGSRFHAYDIDVSGAQTGIRLVGGSAGWVSNGTIENATQDGVMVQDTSTLSLNGGEVAGNGLNGVTVAGGHVSLSNVDITGNAAAGIESQFGGTADLSNCTVEHNRFGVHTFDGAEANLVGSTVQFNDNGVNAQGADANVQSTVVRENQFAGVTGTNGARLTLQGGTVVENNNGVGVQLMTGSSLEIQNAEIIRDNSGTGIQLGDTSVADISNDVQVVDNGGWGIWCEPSPATAVVRGFGGVGTVTGNGQGQIGCLVLP